MDPALPQAEAIAQARGRILALGAAADMRALLPGARVIDAGGRLVLPGLIDAHVHLQDGGTDLAFSASLYDADSFEVLIGRMAATSARIAGPMVVGAGWLATRFGDGTDGRFTRAVLDSAVPDRHAIAYETSYHMACLNSAGCALIGLDRVTEDPENGHIVRDAAGRPTGMLHEEAIGMAFAMGLPAIPPDWREEGVRQGQAHANRHAITGVLDPSITPEFLCGWQAVDAAGGLTLRARGAWKVLAHEEPEEVVARIRAMRAAPGRDFRVTAAKIFLDGVLENRTAAMISPYADAAGGNAPVMFAQSHLNRLCALLDAERIGLHFHCIGDAAARAALDAIEAARAANGAWPALPQIAHCQIVDPADRGRFAELGAMANIQPFWARRDPGDHLWHDMTGSRDIYPFRSLIDAGAPFCLSSDFPVTTLNPFEIIEIAVTRRLRGGQALSPDQTLTVGEAVAGYTTHAAAAMWTGGECGRLSPGLSADLVLLDQNIFACPPDRIADTRVLLTLFRGREVWRDPSFPA